MLPKGSSCTNSGSGSTTPSGNNLNNNNNILNKRNYPFQSYRNDSKIAKICEISFRPLVQKVFSDSEIIKLKVKHGALLGDSFTSCIYAVEAHLKHPCAIHKNNKSKQKQKNNNNNNNNNSSNKQNTETSKRSNDRKDDDDDEDDGEERVVHSTNNSSSLNNSEEENEDANSKSRCDGETDEILHLFMKCFPNHPARQDFFRKIDIFRKELDVYRVVLPELLRFQKERLAKNNRNSPQDILSTFSKFYGGAYGEQDIYLLSDYDRFWEICGTSVVAHGNFILMEDLRRTQNYQMLSKYIGLDMAHCTLVVQELAKLHALSMAYIKVRLNNECSLSDRFDCLKETIVTTQTEATSSAVFNASFGTSIDIVIRETGEDSVYSEKMRRFGNRVHWIFGHILAGNGDHMSLHDMLSVKPNFSDLHDQNKERKRDNWFVFTHGDCYVNNILFKYDQTGQPTSVKLVDLQLARENSLTIDLVNFLYLSTTQAFRKENIDKILELYYDSFISCCHGLGVEPYKDFTLPNLVSKFHKAKIWGFINSLFVLPVLLADGNEQAAIIDIDKVDDKMPLENSTLDARQMFNFLLKQGSKSNEKLYTRIVQLVKEMVDEGVI